LKSPGPEPLPNVRNGGELTLSGSSLMGLLRAVLDRGKPFRFRAKGFSMAPSVKHGDVITVSPLSGRSLRVGDVAAYVSEATGNLVVHRVVARRGGDYGITGDAMLGAAEQVTEANILGLVTRVERNGKDVCFRLGPERHLVAFLRGRRLIWKMARPFWRVLCPAYIRRRGFA